MSDLTSIPFDHYQRYAAAANLVEAIGARAGTVLEVGANRQKLLRKFLPHHGLLFTDIEPQEDTEDFIVADACDLPFADQSHDVVVSLDVLEHISPELRHPAVSEMARVAARMVVIGCPLDKPWVHEAEQVANSVWRRYFNQGYPWLEEHEEHGLVDASLVEASLRAAGLQVIRFGQGDTQLWASMMGAHFMKEAVSEFAAVVAAADSYYNKRLFLGDRSDTSYREFFIGIRHSEDVAALRAAALAGPPDDAGGALLLSLCRGLLPVADRVHEAELQWRQTAETLADTEVRFQQEALAHHHTGLKLGETASSATEQLRRADAADEKCIALDARLQQEVVAHHQTGLKLQESEVSAVEQLRRADAADEKCIALDARLQQEIVAHHQTGLKLQESEASAVEQLRRADSADEKYIALDARLQQEVVAHHQTGLKLQESEASAVEQLRRADSADEKCIALDARLQQEVLAHQQTGLKLQESEASAVEQLWRADAADEKYVILESDVERTRVQLQAALVQREQLLLRIRGLERRQRWATIIVGLVATSIFTAYLLLR